MTTATMTPVETDAITVRTKATCDFGGLGSAARSKQRNPSAWVKFLTHAGGFRNSCCDSVALWARRSIPFKQFLI